MNQESNDISPYLLDIRVGKIVQIEKVSIFYLMPYFSNIFISKYTDALLYV
jgi:hypothetical protein